jgi:hypothetical protein
MAQSTQRRAGFRFPPIQPGDWQGEVLPGGSVNLGQTVQDGPPRRTVEFSYMTIPASIHAVNRGFRWPAVIMIVTPTPMRLLQTDAGLLLKNDESPSLMLTLEVTRGQFSDMLRLLHEGRLKDFHFTVEQPLSTPATQWPVRSWGMTAALTSAR